MLGKHYVFVRDERDRNKGAIEPLIERSAREDAHKVISRPLYECYDLKHENKQHLAPSGWGGSESFMNKTTLTQHSSTYEYELIGRMSKATAIILLMGNVTNKCSFEWEFAREYVNTVMTKHFERC